MLRARRVPYDQRRTIVCISLPPSPTRHAPRRRACATQITFYYYNTRQIVQSLYVEKKQKVKSVKNFIGLETDFNWHELEFQNRLEKGEVLNLLVSLFCTSLS